MYRIVCEYTNIQGHTVLVMINKYEDQLYLLDMDTMNIDSVFDNWALSYVLEDIDYQYDIKVDEAWYDNLVEYLNQDEEDEELLKALLNAQFIEFI